MSNIEQASGTHQAAGDPRIPVIQPAGLLYDRLLVLAGGLLLAGSDVIYGERQDEEDEENEENDETGPMQQEQEGLCRRACRGVLTARPTRTSRPTASGL